MLLRPSQACGHPLLVKDYDSDSVGKDSVEMAKRLPREMLINLFNSLQTTSSICCVCNDPPDDPVITMCGHVFCYQCVSEYLTGDDNMCPSVRCKEHIGDDVVFSKSTLRSCISDDPDASSSSGNSQINYSRVQQGEYSSSKINAVNCKLKPPSDLRNSPGGNRGSPFSDDSYIEDCDSDVQVTKHTRKYSESKTEGPIKAIVFPQCTSMLDLVESSLEHSGLQYRRLDGRMSLAARDRAIKDFNTDPEDEKRKMVASAFGKDHAGGTGTRPTVDDLKYLFMV